MRDYYFSLQYVSDQFKTKEKCDGAVTGDAFSLQYVPDWFVIQDQVKLWHDDDDDDDDDDDELIEWYNGYKKRKT